jgi:tetratricopeptide (TPR) repeat protein
MNKSVQLEQCRSAFRLYRNDQYDEALRSLKPLLPVSSGVASLLRAVANNLAAFCFVRLGRRAQAEHHWRSAIEAHDEFADACLNLAVHLRQSKRYAEAQHFCERAIALNPRFAVAYNSLGNILMECKRVEDAAVAYRQAIELAPGYAEALYNHANALYRLKRFADAVDAYHRALAIEPDRADASTNLGITLHGMDRSAEAEAAFRHVLALRPTHAEAHHGLANLLRDLERLAEAEQCYRKALDIRPGYRRARVNLAFFLLREGRYTEGWALYESRYDEPGFVYHASRVALRCAQWRGESLEGKSLLIFQEDGLGDMLQFGRYLSELKAQGAAFIAVGCDKPLHRLLQSHDAVDAVSDAEVAIDRSSGFDFWSSLMSVPHHLGTTIDTIPPAAYLRTDPALAGKWRSRLDVLPAGHRVGLVWKGNPSHTNDANRSMPSVSLLAPLWTIPGANFVSLQKGQGEDEARNAPSGQPILHLGSDFSDLADTAAVIEQLDLVICVDTSTAHLAGSLGKPCWVMLPAQGTDWRWMREREDSPWYPDTMRVFRQPSPGDWESTVQQVWTAYVETWTDRTHCMDLLAG